MQPQTEVLFQKATLVRLDRSIGIVRKKFLW